MSPTVIEADAPQRARRRSTGRFGRTIAAMILACSSVTAAGFTFASSALADFADQEEVPIGFSEGKVISEGQQADVHPPVDLWYLCRQEKIWQYIRIDNGLLRHAAQVTYWDPNCMGAGQGGWRTTGNSTNWAYVPGAYGASTFALTKAAVSIDNTGELQIAAIATNGLLYHTLRRADGSWTGFAPVQGAYGAPNMAVSDIAMTLNSAIPGPFGHHGYAHLVAIGAYDHRVYHIVRDGWGYWTYAGWGAIYSGEVGQAASVKVYGHQLRWDDRDCEPVTVWVTLTNGHVYSRMRNGDGSGTWTDWVFVS